MICVVINARRTIMFFNGILKTPVSPPEMCCAGIYYYYIDYKSTLFPIPLVIFAVYPKSHKDIRVFRQNFFVSF